MTAVIAFSVAALALALIAVLLLIRRPEARWDTWEQDDRERLMTTGLRFPGEIVYRAHVAPPLALTETPEYYGARRFDKPSRQPLWCERTDEHGTIGWAVI